MFRQCQSVSVNTNVAINANVSLFITLSQLNTDPILLKFSLAIL